MQYIKSNDGIKIAVYDYNPKEKQTVFLIHGWPLSHKGLRDDKTPEECIDKSKMPEQ